MKNTDSKYTYTRFNPKATKTHTTTRITEELNPRRKSNDNEQVSVHGNG